MQILLIINYLTAFYMLFVITNDAIWSMIVRDMKFGKDLVEQQKITKTEKTMRHMFCWLLIIPGSGMVMLITMLMNAFKGK